MQKKRKLVSKSVWLRFTNGCYLACGNVRCIYVSFLFLLCLLASATPSTLFSLLQRHSDNGTNKNASKWKGNGRRVADVSVQKKALQRRLHILHRL